MFVSENSSSRHDEEGKPGDMFVVLCVCWGRAGEYVTMTSKPTESSTTLFKWAFPSWTLQTAMNSEAAAGEGSPREPQLCNMIIWFTDQDTGTWVGWQRWEKQKPVFSWELLRMWKGKERKKKTGGRGEKLKSSSQKRVRDRQGAMRHKDPSTRAQRKCTYIGKIDKLQESTV